jgi:hypothetical protein
MGKLGGTGAAHANGSMGQYHGIGIAAGVWYWEIWFETAALCASDGF